MRHLFTRHNKVGAKGVSNMLWLIAPLLLIVFIVLFLRIHKARDSLEQNAYPMYGDFSWLPDSVRSLSTWVCGGKGSGKSSLVGMMLCYRTFMSGVGQLIIESSGGGALTDYLLNRILKYAETLPEHERRELFSRIIYINMASDDGYVVSWPLLSHTGCHSLFEVAQRLIETMTALDRTLAQGAPVEGANALKDIATNIVMILAALDLQITESDSLLNEPEKWKNSGLLDEAIRKYPEVKPAVQWYRRQYSKWKDDLKTRRTGLFRIKTEMFLLDPLQRAIYGGDSTVDFSLLAQGCTIIVDFRNVLDAERYRWGMTWNFRLFMSYVKSRELRAKPIHLCLDELAQFVSADEDGQSLFSGEVDTLVNTLARNKKVFATLMNQSPLQLSERMRNTLMTCGNKMLGYQSNLEAAIEFGKHLFPYSGRHVKRVDPIFVGSPDGPLRVGERETEFTPNEYERIVANAITHLPRFHFFVQTPEREGSASTKLGLMAAEMGEDDWPDKEKVAAFRKQLAAQSGKPLQEVLDAIDQRYANLFANKPKADQVKPEEPDATLNSDETNHRLSGSETEGESEDDLSN